MELIIPLLVIFAGLMFLASRRQKKEAKAVQTMQDSLAPGDLVMTTSGLHGTVVEVDEDTVDLEIAEDVVTTWNRLAIRERVVTPADAVDPLAADPLAGESHAADPLAGESHAADPRTVDAPADTSSDTSRSTSSAATTRLTKD